MKYFKRTLGIATFAAGGWWGYSHTGTLRTINEYLSFTHQEVRIEPEQSIDTIILEKSSEPNTYNQPMRAIFDEERSSH